MSVNLKEISPVIMYDDNVLLTRSGNLIYGYLMELPEIYTLSEKDYEYLHFYFNLKTGEIIDVDIIRNNYFKKGKIIIHDPQQQMFCYITTCFYR